MRITASQKISECSLQPKTDNYEVLESKSGHPVIKVNGQLFNSIYNPNKEAEKRVLAYNFVNKKAAFLFGDGFYYLAEYLSRKLKIDTYVFEADSGIARLALDNRGESALKSFSIYFIDKLREENLSSLLIPFDNLQVDDVVMIEHLPSINTYKEDYRFIQKKIVEEFKKGIANISTTSFFGRRWFFNILLNLNRNKSFFNLNDVKKSVAYIVIAPGPTLDEIVAEIKKYRNRYKIIALAPSVRNLLSNGINPDFVCSMDGGYANALHLAGINLNDVPLIYPLYVNSNVTRLWKGPLFPVSFNLSVENSLGNKGVIPSFIESATVSVFAIQAAIYLGAESVYIAGMDFASYSCKGHCRDYRFIQDINFKSFRTIGIEKSLDTPWRKKWEKKGAFLSDKKFISYKNELVELIRNSKIKIKSLTKCPFIEEIPIASIDSIQGHESFSNYLTNIVDKETIFNKNKMDLILKEAREILILLNEKKNLNETLMKTMLNSEAIGAILEFLRAADVFSLKKNRIDKAIEGFFNNLLYDINKIIRIIG